jgi:hypothetical protein
VGFNLFAVALHGSVAAGDEDREEEGGLGGGIEDELDGGEELGDEELGNEGEGAEVRDGEKEERGKGRRVRESKYQHETAKEQSRGVREEGENSLAVRTDLSEVKASGEDEASEGDEMVTVCRSRWIFGRGKVGVHGVQTSFETTSHESNGSGRQLKRYECVLEEQEREGGQYERFLCGQNSQRFDTLVSIDVGRTTSGFDRESTDLGEDLYRRRQTSLASETEEGGGRGRFEKERQGHDEPGRWVDRLPCNCSSGYQDRQSCPEWQRTRPARGRVRCRA